MSNLLVLLVVVPILAAIVSAVGGFRGRHDGWTIATGALLVTVGLSTAVASTVSRTGRISYAVGGYVPPYGIELVADSLSVLLCVVTATVSLGALLFMRRESHSNHFYTVYLLLIAGVFGLGITGDLFTMYVFFEITGLAAYVLVASGKGGAAIYAAFKYLLVGTIGATFYLFGVGYLYIVTGALNMADIAGRLGGMYGSPAVIAAALFIVVGLAVKIPLFPVHTWLPDAHSKAPPSASAVISALVTAAAAYALIRVLFDVFTIEFLTATPLIQTVLVTLAAGSVLLGTTVAARQQSVKRMLAYSTVSQFGLVVIGISIANTTALTGSVIHLAGHAVMKAGLFLAAGAIASSFGATTVDEYAGLGQRAPILSAAFMVLALAMVGIPPGVGFFGKWYIVLGAVQAEAWPVAVVIFLSTLLTLGYFVGLLERIYFGTPTVSKPTAATDGGTSPPQAESDVDTWKLAVVLVAAVGAVGLGFVSTPVAGFLEPVIEGMVR
jgi:multicomponent Na+:H+ antiporter subunit D